MVYSMRADTTFYKNNGRQSKKRPKTVPSYYFDCFVDRLNQASMFFSCCVPPLDLPLVQKCRLVDAANKSKNPINTANRIAGIVIRTTNKLTRLATACPQLRSETAKDDFELMKSRVEVLAEGKIPVADSLFIDP